MKTCLTDRDRLCFSTVTPCQLLTSYVYVGHLQLVTKAWGRHIHKHTHRHTKGRLALTLCFETSAGMSISSQISDDRTSTVSCSDATHTHTYAVKWAEEPERFLAYEQGDRFTKWKKSCSSCERGYSTEFTSAVMPETLQRDSTASLFCFILTFPCYFLR